MDSHIVDELVVPLKFPEDSVHFLSLLVLVTMKFKRKSKSRMGMRPSDERSNHESIYTSAPEEAPEVDMAEEEAPTVDVEVAAMARAVTTLLIPVRLHQPTSL
ncbi:hypothetical protein Taro_035662 [Colocasia esculenta]|uniref:Uncharacterized protein n=1 Tax=Colocasia esculenta TaxID=4460 RepID=A0A843WB54_COLES|nr:hypothetical protein [Colocasia esculenta]